MLYGSQARVLCGQVVSLPLESCCLQDCMLLQGCTCTVHSHVCCADVQDCRCTVHSHVCCADRWISLPLELLLHVLALLDD